MEQTETIKTETGELYVKGDTIVGQMLIEGDIIKWFKGDNLHREGDLPAYVKRTVAGVVKYEAYWRDGILHRDGDLPAVIWRNGAGAVKYEMYYRDGKRHRDGDLPAVIERKNAQYLEEHFAEQNVPQSINSLITLEEYWRDGKQHRDGDLPAYVRRTVTGVFKCEEYLRNGKLHRDGDLPAAISRNDAGVITREAYYCDGKRHRDGNLPAVIERNDAGTAVIRELYWRDGKQIAPEQILLEKKKQESAAVIEKLTQEVSTERAKNIELQSQLDQLRQKIKAIVE